MSTQAAPGDQVRVSVGVRVAPERAFRIFTEEIDRWWRRGRQYRMAKGGEGILCLEPRLGGRIFESFETRAGSHVVETGKVTLWDPPARLVFEWRAANFAPDEKTEVEVLFEATAEGTLVTLTHRGFSRIRPDHPVRHGQDVVSFVRTLGLWWGGLLTSLREHAPALTPE